MMTNGPAAQIGEVMNIPFARPHRTALWKTQNITTCAIRLWTSCTTDLLTTSKSNVFARNYPANLMPKAKG